MILVQDLDLVPGFTNRHTTILGPEMFDHAIFADAEIPLRTRIFLRLRNRLLFLLQIPGREHPPRLLFGIARVNAGFFRRCRVASNVFFWRCPLVILVKDPKLLAAITNHETAVGCPDISLGSWSSCLRMYSQIFLVSSVRGSGSFPTTAASAASGCTGLLRALLAEAAFFGAGIGQLERARLGSQAKNQPCFKRFAKSVSVNLSR